MTSLLPGWDAKLDQVEAAPEPVQPPSLARRCFVEKTTFVENMDDARQMVQAAYEFPISYVGMDTEFRYVDELPIRLRGGKEWRDIRSVRPFCIAFAMVSDGNVLSFVVDLRRREMLAEVQKVLDLPVPFVCHYAKAELFVLWSLELREPRMLWDTYLAEKALHLGKSHYRAAARVAQSDAEAADENRRGQAEEAFSLSLLQTANRYGVPTSVPHDKQRLQTSFLSKPFDEPLTRDEIEYCAADARSTAGIREAQRVACDRAGICEVLDRVIMPWNVTVAEMECMGVLFDREKCNRFLNAMGEVQSRLGEELRQHGIETPGSPRQLGAVLAKAGLAASFPKTKTGNVCTKDDVLEAREHLHPSIPLFRHYKKTRQLATDPAVIGQITGADGRVHADFRPLGAASGRTQSSTPNLMGLGKVFRPLVRATPGYGIVDVDLSQIEVAIAAAVFQDDSLIRDFNTGDVYVAMAKNVFAEELSEDDRRLRDADFKARHKRLRNRTKPLVLGIIYGKTVQGIARDLRINRGEAQRLWEKFETLYPTLCQGMAAAREQSVRRGYAYISGLRRFRACAGRTSPHEQRALGNACVQGTAALVFCDAGNRLRQLCRQYGARLLVPVHDSYVVEAPEENLETVATLTESVMVQTVQEWFPELRPRAEINRSHPECWNHEGHFASLERFIEDPTWSL